MSDEPNITWGNSVVSYYEKFYRMNLPPRFTGLNSFSTIHIQKDPCKDLPLKIYLKLDLDSTECGKKRYIRFKYDENDKIQSLECFEKRMDNLEISYVKQYYTNGLLDYYIDSKGNEWKPKWGVVNPYQKTNYEIAHKYAIKCILEVNMGIKRGYGKPYRYPDAPSEPSFRILTDGESYLENII
jgi:hypothetical protein